MLPSRHFTLSLPTDSVSQFPLLSLLTNTRSTDSSGIEYLFYSHLPPTTALVTLQLRLQDDAHIQPASRSRDVGARQV
jgi:hypothetical protein